MNHLFQFLFPITEQKTPGFQPNVLKHLSQGKAEYMARNPLLFLLRTSLLLVHYLVALQFLFRLLVRLTPLADDIDLGIITRTLMLRIKHSLINLFHYCSFYLYMFKKIIKTTLIFIALILYSFLYIESLITDFLESNSANNVIL